MAISYNRLWKLLIGKNMKKMELCRAAGISTNALAKLWRCLHVTAESIFKRGEDIWLL